MWFNVSFNYIVKFISVHRNLVLKNDSMVYYADWGTVNCITIKVYNILQWYGNR